MLDCLIIGGGPAGLTAAIYLGRFRRNIALIDGGASRAAFIPSTHNCPGFPEGISGNQLLSRLGNQASRYREAFFTASATARRFDQDDATIVIDGVNPGSLDIANATYHQATPEEWDVICLSAGSSCGKTPTSTTVP